MKKNVIRLNENQLTNVVAETVKRILKEATYTNDIGDLMGMEDGYDGPTNAPDYDDYLYSSKSLRHIENALFDRCKLGGDFNVDDARKVADYISDGMSWDEAIDKVLAEYDAEINSEIAKDNEFYNN